MATAPEIKLLTCLWFIKMNFYSIDQSNIKSKSKYQMNLKTIIQF